MNDDKTVSVVKQMLEMTTDEVVVDNLRRQMDLLESSLDIQYQIDNGTIPPVDQWCTVEYLDRLGALWGYDRLDEESDDAFKERVTKRINERQNETI
jgi:hypothetical protein